jgi:hypothetical protein
MRKIIIAALLLAGLAAVVLPLVGFVYLAAMPWGQPSGPRPTDAQMMAHLETHRAAFETIVAMLKQDPALKRVGKDFTEPDDAAAIGVSAERLAQYRELCRKAGVPNGFWNFGGRVVFLYYGSGIYIRGTGKNFVFGTASGHAEAVDGDLDEAAKGRRHVVLERQLDTHWWLQLDD